MKKPGIYFILMYLFMAACSKNAPTANNSNNTTTTTPPATTTTNPPGTTPIAVAPVPGSLKTNINNLTLHVGDNATVIATLTDQNGNKASSSNLVWASDNSAFATVSNGIVSAKAIGSCNVSVTDGIHGLLYVTVNVVDNSVAISTAPVSVDFANDLLIVTTNGTTSLGYTLYDAKGNAVTATATLGVPSGSGLTISSTNLSAGTTSGTFIISVIVNKDTLNNALQVLVSAKTDTAYTVNGVVSYARFFYANGVSATTPVLIKVTKSWIVNGKVQQYVFITSPDELEFGDGNVQLDGGGYLQSVNVTTANYYVPAGVAGETAFGCTKIKATYKGSVYYFPVFVVPNVSGSYGGTSGGNSYNYCISQGGVKLALGASLPTLFSFNAHPYQPLVSGTFLELNGTKVITNSPVAGLYNVSNISNGSINFMYGNISAFFNVTNSGNNIVMNPGNLSLTKGAGNCVVPVDTTKTTPPPNTGGGTGTAGADSLVRILESKSWENNACFATISDDFTYTFKADGTGTQKDNGTSTVSTFTWAASATDVVTITFPTGYYIITVSSYSTKGILFSKMMTHDTRSTPADQTLTTGVGGCVLGIK